MKKLFALMAAALLMLTACQISDEGADNTSDENKIELTHPGEYLTDYVNTLSIGSHTFPFTASQSEAKEIFGEDMKYTATDKRSYGEINEKYIFSSDIVDDGYYWGFLMFWGENGDPDETSLFSFSSDITFDGDDGIRGTPYIDENGEYIHEEYPFEEGKVTEKVNGFTAGISTRKEIQEYFGEGVYWDVEVQMGESYVFEDYAIIFFYDENDIFCRCFISSAATLPIKRRTSEK